MGTNIFLEHRQNVLAHLMRIEQHCLCTLDAAGEGVLTGSGIFHRYYLSDLAGKGENVYALLLQPLFPRIEQLVLVDIDSSLLLYKEHVRLLRSIGGQEMGADQHSMFVASCFLQESLGILYRYFPHTSYFWYEFEQHQQHLMQILTRKSSVAHDQRIFERVTAGNAAIAKCTLAALATIMGSFEPLESLPAVLDEIAQIKQLYHEVKHWQKDREQQRGSFVLQRFASEMRASEQLQAIDEKTLKQLFLTSETVRTTIHDVQARLERLLDVPVLAPCTLLLQDLRKLHKVVAHQRDGIDHIWRQSHCSQVLPQGGSCRERALWFLTTAQSADGTWRSMYLGGTETCWVNGYIAARLQQYAGEQALVEQTAQWLQEQRRPEGGWGYRRTMALDADSTAACLSLLASRLSFAETQRAVAALLTLQADDGGFRVYTRPDDIALGLDEHSNLASWCEAQPCVTAAALLALCQACQAHSQLACEEAIGAAVCYLLQQQQPDGRWQSNRWRGSIVPTGMVLQALQAAAPYSNEEQSIREAQRRGRAFLLLSQLLDGAWRADEHSSACPFQSAVAVAALAGCEEEMDRTSLKAASEYLHRAQYLNGCWHASTELLRFPPEQQSEQSTGTPVLDHLHVFTTATVLHALALIEAGEQHEARVNR